MECLSVNGSTSNACSEVRNLLKVLIACQTDGHNQEGCMSPAIEFYLQLAEVHSRLLCRG